MALEMQKLQREHGFNPILGCLPMLAQIPVFLGLYHVLRSFNRTQGGFGQPKLSPELNRTLGNYVFSATDVAHFLDANLFGAPLGATMIQKTGLDAFTEFNRASVIAVGVPLMIAGRHRDVLQQPGIGRPAESRGGGQPADRDDEQAGAVRVPARRRGGRPVPAPGDHPVLVREQHLDLRSAALRLRQDREGRRGEEARGDRATRGQCPATGRQAQTCAQGGGAELRRTCRRIPTR